MKFTTPNFVVAVFSLFLLAGCGGGGAAGGTAATTSAPTTFPLRQVITNLYISGYQKSVTVGGTFNSGGAVYPVTGSLQLTESPANVSSTFNGQSALQQSGSITGPMNVNNETLNFANTGDAYLTTNYIPLGETGPNLYCVAKTAVPLPATVIIGQTGPYVTSSCFTDSTMATALETITTSFQIGAGISATTATASVIDVVVNTANQQTETTQTNYIIDTSGNFSFQSINIIVTINGALLNITAQ